MVLESRTQWPSNNLWTKAPNPRPIHCRLPNPGRRDYIHPLTLVPRTFQGTKQRTLQAFTCKSHGGLCMGVKSTQIMCGIWSYVQTIAHVTGGDMYRPWTAEKEPREHLRGSRRWREIAIWSRRTYSAWIEGSLETPREIQQSLKNDQKEMSPLRIEHTPGPQPKFIPEPTALRKYFVTCKCWGIISLSSS
jgi:hypothetical protein